MGNRRRWSALILILGLWLCGMPAAAQTGVPGGSDYDLVLEDVQLAPGVAADLHLKVFVDESRPCVGRTVLAIPGFAHTAETFGPLAEALFASAPPGQAPCRIVALDFPGHGESGLPTGMTFGQLGLDQYVSAVIGALEQLPSHGLRPRTILAHSQGALAVQLAQQRLTAADTSLRAAFNVRRVVLLAPVPPREVSWAFADTGAAAGVLSGFITFDPTLGLHVVVPDAAWVQIFFSNAFGILPPGAPTPADVAAKGFNAPEPLTSALELVGALGQRRSVGAGIFGPASRTSLQVVTFEHDLIIRPAEGAAVYAHLTGDTSEAGLVEVGGVFAVHDMYISDPLALLNAIAGVIRLR